MLKKNLRQFDGFDFDIDSTEYKKRIEATQKLELAKLKGVCEGLQLDKKGAKDVLCHRICEFLLAPKQIDAPTDDEDDEEDEDDEVEEGNCCSDACNWQTKSNALIYCARIEEEVEEPEEKKPKGRGNARNATSKGGRPRRSTAGRGKGKPLTQ